MQTQINLRTLAAVSIVASKEETRYYLNGVLIQCRADHVIYVATDGHHMIVVRDNLDLKPRTVNGVGVGSPDEPNTLIGDFIVPTEICRTYKAGKGKHRAGAYDLSNLTQTGVELRLDGPSGVQVFKPVDGTFPDYTRVLPGALSGETDGITWNSAYLADFTKFGEMMDCGKGQIAYNGKDPAPVVFNNENVLAVLMPMRGEAQGELATRFAAQRAFVLGEHVEQIAKATE